MWVIAAKSRVLAADESFHWAEAQPVIWLTGAQGITIRACFLGRVVEQDKPSKPLEIADAGADRWFRPEAVQSTRRGSGTESGSAWSSTSWPASAEGDHPALRLVSVEPEPRKKPLQPLRRGKPITEATDPRWVLAMRATALMEGPILRPEHRRTLQKLARVMGLSSFECNLIIAIVQDRARRGLAGDECPDAALEQLALVRQPMGRQSSERDDRWARAIRIGAIVTALLALQLFLIWWAI